MLHCHHLRTEVHCLHVEMKRHGPRVNLVKHLALPKDLHATCVLSFTYANIR